MVNTVSINIEGLKELHKKLETIANEVGSSKSAGIFTSALKEGAKEYEAELKRTAPVSPLEAVRNVKRKDKTVVQIYPGFLKSRIKIKASTNRKGKINKRFGKKDVSLVRVGVFSTPYIVQVEFGTSKHKPQPFMRNAVKTKSHSAVNIVREQLAKKIQAAAKRIAKQKGIK